jgi:proteasome lid subunit RPN8/RPN11
MVEQVGVYHTRVAMQCQASRFDIRLGFVLQLS